MLGSTLSPTTVFSDPGVIPVSDAEQHLDSGSQSDSDFEVVLVTQATANLALSEFESGSLISAPTDLAESSDDEHIFVPNISQSASSTPCLSARAFLGLPATSCPMLVPVARPIIEHNEHSDASYHSDDSSVASSCDSDPDDDGSVRAWAQTLATINDSLEAPVSLGPTTSVSTAHANASAATIRPASAQPASRTLRRSAPAGMHAPAITTNTIAGMAAAPLSPLTPSDGGEIPYVPFTAAPTAVSVPVPIVPTRKTPLAEPPIPTSKIITRKMWAAMNTARLRLGFKPLGHTIREKLNEERGGKKAKTKAKAEATLNPQKVKSKSKSKSKSRSKSKSTKAKVTNPFVVPPPTIGGSPVSSEDECPRARVSMFSPVHDIPVRSDSPDEQAYDEAIKQLDEHMSCPPENPTAAYRYLLNRALLLEFRICTHATLPTSHGAAIAMVKANVHINVLDYVAKRKEGFEGLRAVMLASAKALRKDVRKRRMPAKTVKALGLHSLLIQK